MIRIYPEEWMLEHHLFPHMSHMHANHVNASAALHTQTPLATRGIFWASSTTRKCSASCALTSAASSARDAARRELRQLSSGELRNSYHTNYYHCSKY